jgi:hypothetical protein
VNFVAAGREEPFEGAQRHVEWYATLPTVPRYDLGWGFDPGVPDGLVMHDVKRTWWLRGRIARADYPEWVRLSVGIDSLWSAVPQDVGLNASEPAYEEISSAALDLFFHFYGAKRKIARVSKVLHLKRPALIPLLDANVLTLYREAIQAPRDARTRVAQAWEAIRADLTNPANQEALHDLRDWLQYVGKNNDVLRAFRSLTDVRLFDIAACWRRKPT